MGEPVPGDGEVLIRVHAAAVNPLDCITRGKPYLLRLMTGLCSTRNVGMVASIGADRVIDYTREDFTEDRAAYDVFFDLAGNRSLAACRRVLKPRGTYIAAGGPGSRWLLGLIARPVKMLVLSPFSRQRLVIYLARPAQEDLAAIGKLMAAGKVTPVIDRRYGLDEVSDALRYLQQNHAQGKVVIHPRA